ncbi:2'-5' RNA ligase family protein [Dactylosporangium siamense]|uniref:2'-5' RNA ligase family protein n=1 Tax=Dactylosporangium siamense TaxID=685454 RepID=UPI0031E82DD8
MARRSCPAVGGRANSAGSDVPVAAAQPPEVRRQQLAGSPGAVRLTVSPWEPVLELHRRLIAATSAGQTNDAMAFRPHIGVAYCNSNELAGPLITKVDPLRELPTVDLCTVSAELVLLRREGAAYRWSTCASVPLGGQRHGNC